MNPVGILIESRATFFAVEPAFVKGNRRAPVIGRDVSYGLPDAGILDDAVGGAAVRTEPLPWSWDIQGNEIIVPECLDVFYGCFLRKLCEIVRCFPGRFVPPKIYFFQLNHTTVRAKRP